MPTLYVVATPIGNLGDLSPRAVQTLRDCALIAAEDTRVTRKLLTRFGIATPMISNHRHNEGARTAELVERMLAEDLAVALVTDAGTPCISDPGYLLVKACAEANIPVLAIPGPSAMAAALSVSGFDCREFAFYGFLPRTVGPLRKKLLAIASSRVPVAVLYESPHRVQALLEAVAETLPGARACVCCDLTKLYESTLHGEAGQVLSALRANPNAQKGEYCVVLDLHDVAPAPTSAPVPAASLEARLLEHMLSGLTLREAEAALRSAGERRNELYKASVRVRGFLDRQAVE
ncbi:MAG: 16S rRNA (cytidine(1402)-2'-O)-methyltransferase [Clostridia bacterium]|nr:16S rRNA (cytidine(1402)-2'-O)-methyltransferase [Clostridia bacterium]